MEVFSCPRKSWPIHYESLKSMSLSLSPSRTELKGVHSLSLVWKWKLRGQACEKWAKSATKFEEDVSCSFPERINQFSNGFFRSPSKGECDSVRTEEPLSIGTGSVTCKCSFCPAVLLCEQRPEDLEEDTQKEHAHQQQHLKEVIISSCKTNSNSWTRTREVQLFLPFLINTKMLKLACWSLLKIRHHCFPVLELEFEKHSFALMMLNGKCFKLSSSNALFVGPPPLSLWIFCVLLCPTVNNLLTGCARVCVCTRIPMSIYGLSGPSRWLQDKRCYHEHRGGNGKQWISEWVCVCVFNGDGDQL